MSPLESSPNPIPDSPEPNPTNTIEPQPDFPLHTLPRAVRNYIQSSSLLTRVPPEMIAFPFFAFIGGLIGTRLRIQVSTNWFERPSLWVALIAATGTGKSPAIRAARLPFDVLQEEFHKANRPKPMLTNDQWLEKRLAENRNPQPPPTVPKIPPARVFTSKIETDELALVLRTAYGITILRDELIGLVRMFNRRGGDDRQRYLSLWSSEPIATVRHGQSDLWIASPVVSIVGGLQPGLLNRLRSRDADGLLERFLPIHVVNKQPYWSEISTDAPDIENIIDLMRLLVHIPDNTIVHRSPEATFVWTTWFNDNVDLTSNAPESVRGFYNKLPAHVSRLALILHAFVYPHIPTAPIHEETMTHAIVLAEFVRTHIHRTMHRLSEDQPNLALEPPLDQAIIRALAESRGTDGWISHNHLRLTLGNPPRDTFDQVIEALLRQHRIEREKEPTTKPGRPRHLYRIQS